MEVVNLAGQSKKVLFSWLHRSLEAEKVVFLPDACPGKSPLPTGTVVKTRQRDWRELAVSDCGRRMRLLKSDLPVKAITQDTWDKLAHLLKRNKGGLGDLGGGNHFLDALLAYDEDSIYFLIHTGSRKESDLVDDYVDQPRQFERQFARTMAWATENRVAVQEAIERVYGRTEVVLDLPHNSYEPLQEGSVVIRKGAVRIDLRSYPHTWPAMSHSWLPDMESAEYSTRLATGPGGLCPGAKARLVETVTISITCAAAS